MQVRSQVPLDHDVRCHTHHTQVTGVKDGRVTVVSGNKVVIVAMSQLQLQLQCCSHNRKVAVKVKVARSQGMRRKDEVSHKLHHCTGK